MEKSAEKNPFVIEIIEAKGLSVTKSKKLPSAFVKIRVEKITDKTRTFSNSSSPTWNRSFLIPDLKLSSMLSLQVFHDGGYFNKNEFLGGIERPISDLLKINDHDIVVKLEALEDKRNIPDRGFLTLRLESDFGAVAGRAVPQASIISSTTSAPKILTVYDSAPDSSAVISAAQSVLAPPQTLMKSLDPIVETLNELAKVHPFASLAWAVVSSLYKIPKAQVVRDQSVIDLCETIADIYSTAKKARVMDRITELKEIIDKMIHQTVECAVFIQEYFDRGFGNRLIHDMISTKSVKIGEFNTVFSKLKRSFEGELGLQIACVSLRSADKIDDLTRKSKLDQLKPVEMLTANRPRCLPSTRLQLIDFITLWATDPSPEQHKNVLWLWGFSGSGKSTLVMTIADMFWKLGRVGAFLFFDRKSAEGSDPNVVIRTLAYKLALFDDEIGEKVASAINRNRDIIQQSFSEQFLKLIVEPLGSIDPLRITGPILIILDALDECGDEKSRELLLSALAQGSANLPISFRFLVTSRPEQDIREVFDPLPHMLPHELDTTSKANIQDISLFIQYRMREITKDQHWPEKKQIDELATKAAGLFIWASTACEFIKGTKKNVNHDKLLKLVLSNPAQVEGQRSVDALYATVLDNLLDWDDEAEVKEYHSIIGTMVAAKTPLSAKAITALHKIDDPSLSWDAFKFVHPVSSLVSGTISDTAPLRPLHKSFDDFLTDDKRSGKHFFIDQKRHSGRLARLCLNRMILRERMSSNDIDEPLELNSNVNLKTHPPEDLQYACRFWSEHVFEGGDDSLYDLVSIFASECLLSWIEQLAINRDLDSAIGSLIMAKTWLDKFGSGNNDAARLISDAERLVRAHFEDIHEFPSCVYTTALPFSPKKSLIRQTYQQALAGRINVVSGVADEWGPCLLSIELNSLATCVAWSHDNAHVVGGLSNGIVVVHSTQTGSLSLSYTGHQVVGEEAPSPILAVAFSSDDCYIFSASANGFLHKWDISGKTLARVDCGPLRRVSFTFHLGGYAACISDSEGTLQLRELEQLTVTTVPIPETKASHVVFSPYGSESPVMAYMKGGSLCMWDLVKNTNLWVFQINSLHGEGGYISGDDDEASGDDDETSSDDDETSGDDDEASGDDDEVSGDDDEPSGDGDEPSVDGTQERESYASDTQEPAMDDPHESAAADVHGSATDDNKSTSDSNIETAADDVVSTSNETKSTSNDDDTASDYAPAFDESDWVVYLGCISVSKTGYVACTMDYQSQAIFVLRGDGTFHGWLSAPQRWKKQRYTPAPIKSLVFSPDGTHLLVGHSWTTLVSDINDSVIRIWSVESCDLIAVVGGHSDTIESLAFPPRSEHRFASTSHDKTIRIWDLNATLTPVSLDAHRNGSGVHCIAFSPDGKHIVTTSYDRDIKVWDAETGLSRTISEHHSWVLGVSFAPDSNTFATCAIDDCMMIWQTESLEWLQTIDTNSKPYNLAHSPLDGSLIAAGHEDHSLCVWDVTDIKLPKVLLNTTAECFGDLLGFSMDGKYVASAGREADVWEIETSVLVLHIQGVEGGLFFSKDGTRLVTLHPEIKIWSIETGQLLQTLPHLAAQLTLSPVKQGHLCSLDPRIFDVSQFVQQHVGFGALSPLSFSNHWILDRNGRKLFRYKGERNAVAWGQKIAFGRWDGVVTIIHVRDEDAS